MTRRTLFAVAGLVVIAALLAFPLRGVVTELLLLPIAYLLWWLNIRYLSIDQSIWWIVSIGLTLLILVRSLWPDLESKVKLLRRERRGRGSVETLARALDKSGRGIYFKWVVANRLGKLAHQILSLREHGKPRSVFAPLVGNGWNPPGEIQGYLEKGLYGSFADFPNSNWNYFIPPQKTLLDHDLEEVVGFLGSNIEDK